MASSRRELQGPKPPPLAVNKDSWKVKKLVPAAAHPAVRRNNPVVVYVRSPKIIHTNPQEFMSLVQSLTGKNGSCSSRRSSSLSSSRSNSSSSGVTRAEETDGAAQLNNSRSGGGGDDDGAELDPLLLTLGQVPFTPSDPSPSFLFCSLTTNKLLQEFSTLLQSSHSPSL